MPEHSCWLVIRGRDIGLFSEHLVLKSLVKRNTWGAGEEFYCLSTGTIA